MMSTKRILAAAAATVVAAGATAVPAIASNGHSHHPNAHHLHGHHAKVHHSTQKGHKGSHGHHPRAAIWPSKRCASYVRSFERRHHRHATPQQVKAANRTLALHDCTVKVK